MVRRDPTRRFSARAEDYSAWRPSYPRAILDRLIRSGLLSTTDLVADIGSGTGKLSELFLQAGHRVIGIEPNDEMRAEARRLLGENPLFWNVGATAEQTALADRSVNVVAAGQAFHWFDPVITRREFLRILRPGGRIVLVWNVRRLSASPFMTEYDDLLQTHALDGERVGHHLPDDRAIASFLAPGEVTCLVARHSQTFDLAGLEGRVLSSSYAPPRDHPGFEPMKADLSWLFERRQKGGQVEFLYEARAYASRVA